MKRNSGVCVRRCFGMARGLCAMQFQSAVVSVFAVAGFARFRNKRRCDRRQKILAGAKTAGRDANQLDGHLTLLISGCRQDLPKGGAIWLAPTLKASMVVPTRRRIHVLRLHGSSKGKRSKQSQRKRVCCKRGAAGDFGVHGSSLSDVFGASSGTGSRGKSGSAKEERDEMFSRSLFYRCKGRLSIGILHRFWPRRRGGEGAICFP